MGTCLSKKEEEKGKLGKAGLGWPSRNAMCYGDFSGQEQHEIGEISQGKGGEFRVSS